VALRGLRLRVAAILCAPVSSMLSIVWGIRAIWRYVVLGSLHCDWLELPLTEGVQRCLRSSADRLRGNWSRFVYPISACVWVEWPIGVDWPPPV
jgi:hypothetical protein